MVSVAVDVKEFNWIKEGNVRMVTNDEVMVTTVKMLQVQMREETAEIIQLKMEHDVLSEAYDAANQTNSRKPPKYRKDKIATFNLHTSLTNKDIRRKFIFTLTYLYNNMARNCTFLESETTMSEFRSVNQNGWFLIQACPGSMKIRN